MTALAALAGTYHNLRPVMGRKVFQVHIELPIEHMEAFVAAFGAPNPDTWIALARLNGVVTESAPTEIEYVEPPHETQETDAPPSKKSWRELLPSQQAGILCADPVFWKFLGENYTGTFTKESHAATFVRGFCKVNSRAQITYGTPKGDDFRELVEKYRAWQLVASVVPA